MTDKTDLIREIHEYVTTHGGENTATHLMVQAASAIQTQAAELKAVGAGGVSGPLIGQPQAMPHWMQYDERTDVLTIHGKRYAAGMFGEDGFLSPPGTWLRVCVGSEDCVTLTRASLAASAGSEPVPFGHWFTDDPKAFATPGSGFLVGKEPPKNAINVIPLYTHPSPPEGMVGGWLSITGTLCSMGNIGEEDLAAISPETPRITLQAADGSVVHIVGLSREHVGGMAPQFYNQAQLILAPRPTTSAGSGKGE